MKESRPRMFVTNFRRAPIVAEIHVSQKYPPMLTSNTERLSDPQKEALLPPLFGLVAIFFPAISVLFLVKQLIPVTAAVYSAFIAVMAIFAAVIFKKKQRRGAAYAALLTCVVSTGSFVVYLYLALKL